MTRFPDDDRHHCKYRRDRDDTRADNERLRDENERYRERWVTADAAARYQEVRANRLREALERIGWKRALCGVCRYSVKICEQIQNTCPGRVARAALDGEE